jgi:hypothetical protein
MRKQDPTIKVTELEYDFLQEERRAANRQIPCLVTRRSMKSGVGATLYGGRLYVLDRDRDGSLRAKIHFAALPGRDAYVRKVRVPGTLGSTSRRGIKLRRGFRPS